MWKRRCHQRRSKVSLVASACRPYFGRRETGASVPCKGKSHNLTMTIKERILLFIWYLQTPPLSYISEALWIIFSGWSLFLLYLMGAISFAFTLVLLPLSIQLLKVAIFSFDPIRYDIQKNSIDSGMLNSPNSPYVIIGNIVWLVFIGWSIFLWHMFLAFVSACTIIGLGNAMTHVEIAFKTLFPLGKSIVKRPLRPRPYGPRDYYSNMYRV